MSQLLAQCSTIFRTARVPVWIRAYDILAITPDAGLIQAIPDTISLDSLKKNDPSFSTLAAWYDQQFNWGPRGRDRLRVARTNFARSLAAYSIVCYILQIKDRHNGNILLDRKGHIMHIDFGFLLTNSPGGNMGFEAAPFKLTQEFVQVLGGADAPLFSTFKKLCVRAFLAARKFRTRILLLVEMMLSGNEHLPCFVGGPRAVMAGLRGRFHEDMSERECQKMVHRLIDTSMDNWRTRAYDYYQNRAQGELGYAECVHTTVPTLFSLSLTRAPHTHNTLITFRHPSLVKYIHYLVSSVNLSMDGLFYPGGKSSCLTSSAL